MPRRASIDSPVLLHLGLPSSVMAKLSLHLYSGAEGCVPRGAYRRFFLERLREFFDGESLDLAPYTGAPPGAFVLRGSPEAIKLLRRRLEDVIHT